MAVGEREIGEDLRSLRLSRGLSLGATATRAGLSKSALMGWESGRSRPRGLGLSRLLDALGAEPRLRARLLHAADPRHARIELANTALGAPVDVRVVFRALRLRRGLTQADVARSAGVSQAAVARWESGEDAPGTEALQRACHALGASPEEAMALACARGEPSARLPEAPWSQDEMRLRLEARLPGGPLREVAALGLEAELWSRAVRDPRWDPVLAYVAGERAIQSFLEGRLGEAEATARRALRLAPTATMPLAATGAFSALLEIDTVRGADPALLARRIEAWAARLPGGTVKGWMLWEWALRLAEMGRAEEAEALNERMAELSSVDWDRGDAWLESVRVGGLLEVELRAGRADRAEALLSAYVKEGPQPDLARRRVRIAHARGEAADEASIHAMREEYLPWAHFDNWYTRGKIARIEREQARLARGC